MACDRNDLMVHGVDTDTLQTHPCKGGGIVIARVDVVGGVAIRETVRVVGHSQFRIGQKMLAARQQAIAVGLGGHVDHALRQRRHLFLPERRDGIGPAVPHRGPYGF